MLLGNSVCCDQCVLLKELCQFQPCFILYSKAKLVCYSRYHLTSYFCILVPYDEGINFGISYEVLQVFIEQVSFSLFSISCWSKDQDYCDNERFALQKNQDPSIIFQFAPNYYILDSFVDYEGYSIFSKKILAHNSRYNELNYI